MKARRQYKFGYELIRNVCVLGQGLLSVIASISCCVAFFYILRNFGISGGWTGRNTLCLLCGNQIVYYLYFFIMLVLYLKNCHPAFCEFTL